MSRAKKSAEVVDVVEQQADDANLLLIVGGLPETPRLAAARKAWAKAVAVRGGNDQPELDELIEARAEARALMEGGS